MSGPAGIAGGRSRPPSARRRSEHPVPLARRLALVGDIPGPHRDVALAALAVRGRRGRSVGASSAALGVPETVLRALEGGHIAVEEVPPPLAVLTDVLAVAAAIAHADDGAEGGSADESERPLPTA